MASIYTHQDSNIRKTWFLMGGFLIVVILIGWGFSWYVNSPIILYVAVGFAFLMNFFSYWYSDKVVIRMTGAKPVSRESHRELWNVLENLSITAGLPMPKLYIMEDSTPNAFATGRNPEHAVVAVTTGLLSLLDRTELEGVLAHELSHIGNRDMLVMTVAVVLVSMFSVWVYKVFYLFLKAFVRSSTGGCVLKNLFTRDLACRPNGLAIKRCAVAWLVRFICPPCAEIFSSADANPSG